MTKFCQMKNEYVLHRGHLSRFSFVILTLIFGYPEKVADSFYFMLL